MYTCSGNVIVVLSININNICSYGRTVHCMHICMYRLANTHTQIHKVHKTVCGLAHVMASQILSPYKTHNSSELIIIIAFNVIFDTVILIVNRTTRAFQLFFLLTDRQTNAPN